MTFTDLIKEKGYTASSLAKAVGCSEKTIKRYENGKSTVWGMKFSLAYKISCALNVSMSDLTLLDGQGEETSIK